VLTLNLLTTTIVAPPSNASKWQMGFNLAFKGLMMSQFKVIRFVRGGMNGKQKNDGKTVVGF
jgi:hypothetical protein